MEIIKGHDYLQWFPIDQLYDLIESLPYEQYPLHEKLCQANPLCGSNRDIRQLLNAIMWLKDNNISRHQRLFGEASKRGILPAMKLLVKYHNVVPRLIIMLFNGRRQMVTWKCYSGSGLYVYPKMVVGTLSLRLTTIGLFDGRRKMVT